MEKIKVKRSILFQISYFRKSVVKKLRVEGNYEDLVTKKRKKKKTDLQGLDSYFIPICPFV